MVNGVQKHSDGMVTYVVVYVAILMIAGLQVVIAYHAASVGQTVMRMFALAVIQAGLGVMFFMHLLREKPGLMFALIPFTLFVLLMMNMIWFDSFRQLHLRPFAF